MTISEARAWQIVKEFACELAAELGEGLLSVIVIGGLSGGYYRPGVSDIDTVVVVTADARPAAEPLVERLREEYRVRYQVPKEFGAFVVTPEQLRPPYLPEEELAPEIQRIVDQGRVVYGAQIPVVPPTRTEMLGYMRWFDRWLETEFLSANPPETLGYHAAYNVAAMACRHYVYAHSGEMIWEKKKALHAFAEREPDHPHITIVQKLIELGRDDPGLDLPIGPEVVAL
jgi:predicted nucleotidyltransferase